MFLSLLPSFVRNHFYQKDPEDKQIRHTAYLDGFRGLASFCVFLQHFFVPWIPEFYYGYYQGVDHDSIFRLPFFRLLYAGPVVPIFFVVSGYVISLKPLELMRNGNWSALLASLTSSIFRRGIRLFLPPIISTLVVMVAVQLNLFAFSYPTMSDSSPASPVRAHDIWLQFADWAHFVTADLTNFWNWKIPPSVYGAHLWTIPRQFHCSIVLSIVILGVSKASSIARRWLVALSVLFCLFHHRWDVALHLSGFFMAEWEMIRHEQTQRLLPDKLNHRKRSTTLCHHLLCGALCFLGLYFASFPRPKEGHGAPGYRLLFSLTPNYRYWHSYGAAILLWCFSRASVIQSLLTMSWIQYLGKISFSMYLVHEPLLHIVGYRIVNLCWRLTSTDSTFQHHLGMALAFCLFTPIVIWVSDLFYYRVERPSGNIAWWLEMQLAG